MANQDIGKLPPNAIEFEEIVLGAMMLEQECIPVVLEIINKQCFYKDHNAIIFNAIETLYKRRDPVNGASVTMELIKTKQLELIGGAYTISTLTSKIISSAGIDYNARIILQQFLRRQIIKTSSLAIEEAYDESNDVLALMDDFVSDWKQLYDHIYFGKTSSTDEILVELMDDMDKKEVNGLSTGIKAIDDYIVCLERGLKYTIAGRPGMGKTSLAKTIACNLISQGIPGIVFSMEVTAMQFMTTVVSGVCEIDSERIRKKELTPAEKQSITNKMKAFRTDLLIIDDKSNITENYILKKVKKAIKTHNIQWFMVDYVQMGRSDNPKVKAKEERIGDFSQGIKNVAKGENLIAIELAQLVKSTGSSFGGKGEKESKRPQVSDIRDSGMIEASADCIMLLYRPEQYGFSTVHGESAKGLAEVIIAKNRQGRTGSALTNFTEQYTKFTDQLKVQHTQENNIDDSIHAF